MIFATLVLLISAIVSGFSVLMAERAWKDKRFLYSDKPADPDQDQRVYLPLSWHGGLYTAGILFPPLISLWLWDLPSQAFGGPTAAELCVCLMFGLTVSWTLHQTYRDTKMREAHVTDGGQLSEVGWISLLQMGIILGMGMAFYRYGQSVELAWVGLIVSFIHIIVCTHLPLYWLKFPGFTHNPLSNPMTYVILIVPNSLLFWLCWNW